jgi:hypothetical protein
MADQTVTNNAPSQPNGYGASTTTQDVNGTITPAAQPTAQPQPATPTAQPATPNAPTAQPNAPAQPPAISRTPTPRHLASRIFDGVLNTLGGGPIYVAKTDPTTGETTRVPVQQSRGQLGKSILAGALAGMFGGMGARDPEGRHDPSLAAEQGFKAGEQFHEKIQNKAQQVSDEEISRRQMVMKANLDTAHQVMALNAGKQNMFEKASATNQSGILADAKSYDQSLTDATQPKAIMKTNLTHDEALQALNGHWSDQLAVLDGYRTAENGDIVPTFTVLNPNVKVKMNEDMANRFGRFNPQFVSAYKATDGNLQMSLHNYADAQNKLNSLEHMDALFGTEAKELGLKSTDFADAVKSVGPTGMKAVIEAENAIAGGGTPVDALRRLSLAPGGAQILNKLGITSDRVEELFNEQVRKEALAKEGGMGPKSPMPDDEVKGLLDAVDSSNIPDEMKAAIRAGAKPDKDGHYNLNMQQGEDLRNRLLTAQNQTNQINERNLLANGDPVQMQKTAQNTLEGDVNDITKIASMRGNARNNAVNAIHDQAANLGLDTTNYSESALESQANMWKDYTGGQKTPTGKQLVSFDAYLAHTGEALAAEQRLANKYLGLYHTPIANKTLKELGTQLTDDQDWAAYSASLEPVKHEIENFLSAGFATKAEDAEAMRAILNDTMPINRMNATLKQLAMTADARLASLGKAYTNNLGRNYTHLLSTEAKQTLDKLGVKSQSAAYASALPRGWNNHQMQKLTDVNVAKQFLAAAGNNITEARELMKRNGWTE